jgi:short-subunit dehydrogenase
VVGPVEMTETFLARSAASEQKKIVNITSMLGSMAIELKPKGATVV